MQIGLYLFLTESGIWRVVSTDSLDTYRIQVASVLSTGDIHRYSQIFFYIFAAKRSSKGVSHPTKATNLFLYLRTVIVTAGVHPRFGSRLHPRKD